MMKNKITNDTKNVSISGSPIKRIIYIIIGCLCVGMGAIGALIPILPTFPFLLLAAVCLAKSSKRLHHWFVGTKLFKNNLESYVKGNGMTIKTKLRIIIVVTATMGIGFLMMSDVPIGRVILVVIWVAHLFYFTKRVKTKI